MRIPIKLILQEFIDLYDLAPKVKNGYVYMEISRGMYGLPQSGILANKLLKKRLANHEYHEITHTPGLFRHEIHQIGFTLVVDNFGIKYVGEENANHLLGVLKEFYKMEEYWTGGLYCGIILGCHYKEQYVDIAMPNYVTKQLLTYGRSPPKQAQHTPFEPRLINYGENPTPLSMRTQENY